MLRIRRISKEYYLRQVISCWLACCMFLGIPAQVAFAPPTPTPVPDTTAGPDGFAYGLGHVDQPGGLLTNVTVQTQESIIHWETINTLTGEDLNYLQDGVTGAAVLNRVTGPGATAFNGNLNAPGMNIWILNNAGIVFGATATINVTQLVASSLEIDDADFINGLPYEFTGGLDAGDVTNEGSITAEVVALIAKNVINRGHIVADECAIMAAGDTVLISENSPVAVEVTMGADWAPDDYSVYQVENVDGDGIEVGQGGEMATAQVVLAAGDIWSAALVTASAGGYEPEAAARVDIDAAGDVTVTNKVIAEASGMGENETIATVTVNAGGDVKVISDGHEGKLEDYKASIQAIARGGGTNTSEVLICADGYVTVDAEGWFDGKNDWPYAGIASIEAIAESIDSMAQNNTADVKIGAKEGIEVTAIGDSYTDASASIAAKATGGVENTAGVVACTEGGVQVIDVGGGEIPHTAKIVAEALNGHTTDAYVGICAVDDVVVAASEDGTAMIKAKAAQYLAAQTGFVTNSVDPPPPPTSANAEVVVVSHEGNIEVTGESGGSARIEADAKYAWTTDASVGVSAENVTVTAGGYGVGLPSDAGIYALARWGFENTADTVVCAPGQVAVVNLEGLDSGVDAGLGAVAWGGELNTATTQVYASDVTVSEGAYIGAITQGDEKYVPGEAAPDPLATDYCLTEDGEVAKINEDGSTLIIQDYSARTDCPDCPPCPCEEEEDLLAPVAPLAQFEIPRVEGCPVLTQAAAMELGITGETLQVAIGNALALNPTIQPCEACAILVNAAAVLRDEDGSRMAAMIQVFNTLAPADAPFTPETAASIAMAFEGAAEGTQYASVMEYIDTFVQYVAVLDIELGSPVGDSVAFVMDKYGAGIAGSDNGNIAAFIATRLEAISQ